MRQVGGERIDSTLLLPPGASPHNFEPSPKNVEDLDKTNLFLFAGAGMDFWANDLVMDNINQSRSDYVAIDISQVVELRPFNDIQSGEEDASPSASDSVDPHYWLSPDNAALIANEIAGQLSMIDPLNIEYYRQNAENFIDDLEMKTSEWQEKISSLENKQLLVFHDAWFYFAEYFNLDIIGAFEPIAGKSPGPKYLQSILDKIDQNEVKTVFIEPQLDPEIATAMVQGKVQDFETLDPLGGLDERDSYIKLIDYNVDTIINALRN